MEDEEEGVEFVHPIGKRRWWRDKEGRTHRLNGPAFIFANGDRSWYRHGKIHRDDGPARIWPEKGIEKWYKNGLPYEPSAHELIAWKMKKEKKE